jgi:capsular polysaccharide biosynthesis protein
VNSLRGIWLMLRRRGWILVVAVVAAGAVAYGVSKLAPLTYTAESTVIVPAFDSGNGGVPRYADQATSLARTYAEVIPNDPAVLARVGQKVDLSSHDTQDAISVFVVPDTAALRLRFKDSSESRALAGAQALTDAVVHSPSGAIQPASLVVVRQAETTTHSGGARRAVPIGLILGLALGIVLMIAWDRADARVDSVRSLRETGRCPAVPLSTLSKEKARALRYRWEQLAGCPEAKIALVPLTADLETTASELATRMAPLNGQASGRANGAPHAGTTEFLVSGHLGSASSVELAAVTADVVVLLVTAGTRLRQVDSAIQRLAEFGAEPAWMLLVPRRRALRRLFRPSAPRVAWEVVRT